MRGTCTPVCPSGPAACTLHYFPSPCMCTVTGPVTPFSLTATAAPEAEPHHTSRRRSTESAS